MKPQSTTKQDLFLKNDTTQRYIKWSIFTIIIFFVSLKSYAQSNIARYEKLIENNNFQELERLYSTEPIQNLTFYRGNSAQGGGAIYLSMTSSQSLSTTRHLITNNIFAQNQASGQGGAISGTGDDMGSGNFQGILTISSPKWCILGVFYYFFLLY